MDERARESSTELVATSAGTAATREPEVIRRDIARTREELGDTVEKLVRKIDVKARAKESVSQRRKRAATKLAETRDGVAHLTRGRRKRLASAVALLVVGGLIGLVLVRR
jgi:hypothetical protein